MRLLPRRRPGLGRGKHRPHDRPRRHDRRRRRSGGGRPGNGASRSPSTSHCRASRPSTRSGRWSSPPGDYYRPDHSPLDNDTPTSARWPSRRRAAAPTGWSSSTPTRSSSTYRPSGDCLEETERRGLAGLQFPARNLYQYQEATSPSKMCRRRGASPGTTPDPSPSARGARSRCAGRGPPALPRRLPGRRTPTRATRRMRPSTASSGRTRASGTGHSWVRSPEHMRTKFSSWGHSRERDWAAPLAEWERSRTRPCSAPSSAAKVGGPRDRPLPALDDRPPPPGQGRPCAATASRRPRDRPPGRRPRPHRRARGRRARPRTPPRGLARGSVRHRGRPLLRRAPRRTDARARGARRGRASRPRGRDPRPARALTRPDSLALGRPGRPGPRPPPRCGPARRGHRPRRRELAEVGRRRRGARPDDRSALRLAPPRPCLLRLPAGAGRDGSPGPRRHAPHRLVVNSAATLATVAPLPAGRAVPSPTPACPRRPSTTSAALPARSRSSACSGG